MKSKLNLFRDSHSKLVHYQQSAYYFANKPKAVFYLSNQLGCLGLLGLPPDWNRTVEAARVFDELQFNVRRQNLETSGKGANDIQWNAGVGGAGWSEVTGP